MPLTLSPADASQLRKLVHARDHAPADQHRYLAWCIELFKWAAALGRQPMARDYLAMRDEEFGP